MLTTEALIADIKEDDKKAAAAGAPGAGGMGACTKSQWPGIQPVLRVCFTSSPATSILKGRPFTGRPFSFFARPFFLHLGFHFSVAANRARCTRPPASARLRAAAAARKRKWR